MNAARLAGQVRVVGTGLLGTSIGLALRHLGVDEIISPTRMILGSIEQDIPVHELLHLRVPNHGRLFKSLMSAYLPEWQGIGGQRIARFCRFSDNGAGVSAGRS